MALVTSVLVLHAGASVRGDEPAAPRAAEPPALVVGLLLPGDAVAARDLQDGLAFGFERAEAAAKAAGSDMRRWVVKTAAATGTWDALARGAAELITVEHALALVTPPDRAAAHLATQVGTRLRTPVLSLSDAPTVTATGSAWVLRLAPPAPAPAAPAAAAAPSPGPSPASAEFAAAFQQRFGRAPGPAAALGHDAARALAVAVRMAPASRGTALRDAFHGLKDVPGARAPFTLDEHGHRKP